MLRFGSGTQQSIVADSDKAFRRHMHKKPTDKFNAGDGIFFPLAFFSVILHIVGNSIFVHADNSMVADGNPVGIFSEIINNGLCTIKGFLTVGNPFFLITDIQELFESIMVAILFTTSMKLKLFLFPEDFEFVQIFASEQL